MARFPTTMALPFYTSTLCNTMLVPSCVNATLCQCNTLPVELYASATLCNTVSVPHCATAILCNTMQHYATLCKTMPVLTPQVPHYASATLCKSSTLQVQHCVKGVSSYPPRCSIMMYCIASIHIVTHSSTLHCYTLCYTLCNMSFM